LKDNSRKRKGDRLLLGVGLDADEQVRVTRGDNFFLVGGSQNTHEQMQEKAMKFNEKLRERGRSLAEIDRKEAREIASEIEMNLI